ncbi:MAG: carboxymuconolactone decarboxylase family protein [Acidimicrobiales bacterium]|nr:carboxymuconolactone decarboxylase family protein [Acidimicrobiales bacterium]
MPRTPVHTPDTAPEESKERLGQLTENVGKTLNIFAEMAHAPVVLETYVTMEQLLASTSSLDEPTRQAIHLTVAQVNDCSYCQAAYTGAAQKAGHSKEATLDIRRGEVPDAPALTALLTLTRQVAANKGHVDDATWAAAIDAGWSDRQILEAYAEVVRTIFTNYFNHLVGTELDLPEVPELT